MKYCINCMALLKNEGETCPVCGKSQNAEIPVYHLVPGTVLQNRYVVGRALGEGGFGITYVGYDERIAVKVAIKEYYLSGYAERNNTSSPDIYANTSTDKKQQYEKFRQRFISEARILARFINEPGIVSVRDTFEENNTAYIVMEYLDGEDLKEYLKKNGPMNWKDTVKTLLPTMKSLIKIHEQDLIHRDISPDNIRMCTNGIKLMDFGSARLSSLNSEKSMSVMLKPGYAPIEQYYSKGSQGPWTDVYALCATMYKCITGITPDESTARIESDTLKKPSELGIRIDADFEKTLMKGMAVNKENRYQSVSALLADMERNVSGSEKTELLETASAGTAKSGDEKIKKENGSDTSMPDPGKYIKNTDGVKDTPRPKTQPQRTGNNAGQNSRKPQPVKKRKSSAPIVILVIIIAAAVISAAVLIWKMMEEDNAADSTETVHIGAVSVGSTVMLGSYEQDNDSSDGKEKIQWTVLAVDGNRALLISSYGLECRKYNNRSAQITWENCSLRKWLNSSFMDAAFTSAEQEVILTTTLVNSVNPVYGTDGGENTDDEIFILSLSEIEQYYNIGENYWDVSHDNLRCTVTDYARSQLEWTSSDNGCGWWLRSPGSYESTSSCVDDDGTVNYTGDDVDYSGRAVRPAMWVKLD